MLAATPGSLVARLAAIGYAPDDDADARLRKSTLALTAATIALLATAWTVAYLMLGRPASAAIPFLYQIAAVLSLFVLAGTKRDGVVRSIHLVLMLLLPVLLQWSLGGFVNGSAVLIWAIASPVGALVFERSFAAVACFVAFASLVVVSGLLDPWLAARAEPLPEAVIVLFFVLNMLGPALVVFLVLTWFVRQRHQTLAALDVAHQDLQSEQLELQAEQARSAGLLRNILPDAIAERLKQGDRVIADRYEAITVLFVDIADFTPLAARLPAADVVRLLDRLSTDLEELCARFGLEKIKTVGDSFMAVAGLPQPRDPEECAVAAAEVALEVLPTVERVRAELGDAIAGPGGLQVRIGLHTGAVVAGVIGRSKLAYDLWGDAVNVASRMESQGVPGEIQVSMATWEYLQRHYRFRYRGTIEVKGRGEMGAYLLIGRRVTSSSATP